ncbi:MAG: 4-vinyl reductase [Elusimicrobia bacterium]|nr:4-vinyl reductase [Elusimicrobiota bacterium]
MPDHIEDDEGERMAKTTTAKKGDILAKAAGLGLIGDPARGRPTLGSTVTVAMFRALRLVGVMEGLDDTLGKDASALVFNSGKHVGFALGKAVLEKSGRDLERYVHMTAAQLKELGVGVMTVSALNLANDFLKVRVDECITCAGMPDIGKAVCHFEGGMVSGVLEAYLGAGKKVVVKEIQCWALGDTTCEFECRIC